MWRVSWDLLPPESQSDLCGSRGPAQSSKVGWDMFLVGVQENEENSMSAGNLGAVLC